MRIALVSELDIKTIQSWSGTPYYMARTYERVFEEVVHIHTPFYEKLTGPVEDRLRQIGADASRQLDRQNVDLIVCQGNSAIPFLQTDTPIAFWHDSSWFSLKRLDVNEFAKRHPALWEWDRQAVQKSSLLVFASEWAARAVCLAYQVPPAKVHVIPFGPNLEVTWTAEELEADINARDDGVCRLTFLGKQWDRKGLPLAVELAARLRGTGMPVELSVIGPEAHLLSKLTSATIVGELDKSNPEHMRELHRILRRTTFLVHPASFECFGIALVEANAFGVPVLSTNVTGIPTIVRDGVNGKLFERDRFVEEAAAYVRYLLEDPARRYRPLARTAFEEYRKRLNWEVSGKAFQHLASQLVRRGESIQKSV